MQRVLVLCAVAVAPLVAAVAVAADDLWSAPAMSAKPAEILRLATTVPAAKDADIETLFEEHSYQFDAQGRQLRSVRQVFRYLTDKGVEDWSCTEADWSPWCEDRPAIHARVITPDGQIHVLDPESIGEVAVEQDHPNLLSDQKLFRAPLPAIQVGAVVEEEVINREVRPLFEHGTVERVLLSQSHQIRKFRLVIDFPAALPFRYEVLGTDVKPVRTEQNGRVTLRFELDSVPSREAPEPFMLPDVCRWPQVAFSTGKSWGDVASFYAALLESQLDLDALKPLVRETIGQETNRDEMVSRLLAVVRSQVRYTGIEFGKAAIVPRAPHETLARRYGDCKDQSALLVAMLRAAGIQACVALLRSGKYSDVVPGLPGLGDFDHCIVYVPGDSPLWIDPSARCVPRGQLPLTDQGRWAMVARPETRELVRTPRLDYRQNTSIETFEIDLSESGKSRVCVAVTGTGSCEDDLRESYAAQSIKELRKAWREFFKDEFHSQMLTRLEHSPPLDLLRPFRVTAEAPDGRIGQFEDAEATVGLQPDPLFDRLPGLFKGVDSDKDDEDGRRVIQVEPGDRRSPLMLPEPHIRQLQFRVTPPPGFVPRALPENMVKKFGPATISQNFEQIEGNVVVATFRLDTGPGTFTAADVNVLRQGIAQLSGNGEASPWEVKIGLEHVAARYLANGRVKEALAECCRLIRAYPDKAELYQRYSQALLKAGLGEAAREQARRAVELAPKSDAAHANLARVLTHDLLGRHFRTGMDWAGAAEAYDKALALDPSDTTIRVDFAILLEHNADGMRYGPGTRLDEALLQYQKAQKQAGIRNHLDQMDLNMALVLLFLERYAELEKLADRSEMSTTWKALMVAAVTAQRGPKEGQRKAAQLGHGADDRRTVLEAAGEYLQEARLYGQAATLLEAAAVGSPEAETLRQRAKTLAPMRRFGEADLAGDGPRRAVQQLFLGVLAGGKAKEQIPALFSKAVPSGDVAAAVESFSRDLAPLLEEERTNQVPPQRMADVLSVLKIQSEGDDANGYRLRIVDEDVKDETWYVVMEDGGARLLAPGPAAANLATMALARLDKGDLAGADRWLRWASEERPRQARRSGAVDPYAGSPFTNLWRSAQHDRAESLRVAAAALLAQGSQPQAALPILLAAPKDKLSREDAIQVDRALALAYLSGGHPVEAIEVADRILKETHRPHEALRCKIEALEVLGRPDDLRRLLQQQLEKTDNDPITEELLALQAMRLGDFDTAEKRLRPLADREKVSEVVLNNLAWNAVSQGSVGQRALDDALAAATRTSCENSACLHTLAAVYAEMGTTTEALENLRRSVQQRGGPLKEIDWYVLGRLAEHYGLDSAATSLFRRIPCPKRPAADSVYALAQQRLKKLKKP